jgi:hypothetical protein
MPRKQLGQLPSCSPWLSYHVTVPEIPYDQPPTVTVASFNPV